MEENNQNPNQPNVMPESPPSAQTPAGPAPPQKKPNKKIPLKILFGLLFTLLLAGGAGTGYVYKNQIVKPIEKTPPSPAMSISASITPTTNWEKTCKDPLDGSKYKDIIFAEKKGNIIVLKDLVNNYQLSFDNYPEFEFSAGVGCSPETGYGFELYGLRKDPVGSIARIGYHASASLKKGQTLRDYAKQELDYIEGKVVDPELYMGEKTSTPLEYKILPSGAELLSWTQQYTDQPMYREGTTASRYYLILANNKLYVFVLSVWDIPTLGRAITDFDKAITTFKFTEIKPLDTSNWKIYQSSDKVLSFKYPSDWWIDTSSYPDGNGVMLYPPEAKPDTPAESISFSSTKTPYLPAPTPASTSLPFEQFTIEKYTGRRSGYNKSQYPIGRIGGCQYDSLIQFKTSKGTLNIDHCESLESRTSQILESLEIN